MYFLIYLFPVITVLLSAPNCVLETTASHVPALSEDQRKLTNLCPELCNTCEPKLLEAYRYDNVTQRCYAADGVGAGPCGKNMVFYGETTNSVYGYCDCDFEKHSRPLIYHSETNQCYFIYDQAYCPNGKWLSLHRFTGVPKCKANLCSKRLPGKGRARKREEEAAMVYFHNRCILFNSWQPECQEGQVVKFGDDPLEPQCLDHVESSVLRLFGVISQRRCRPGSYRMITGKCQTGWRWAY